MERVARKFQSHAESDEADREHYRSLTPEQRIEVMFALCLGWTGDQDADAFPRLSRVCRVIGSKPDAQRDS